MPCCASSVEGWWMYPWMLSTSILRTRKSSLQLAADTSSRGLQQRRDQRARSLSSFFFCPCVFWALAHLAFFNYVSKYVRQLLSTVIVLIFIMLAISRSRCYIGPSDLTSRSVQNFLSRFSFFSLKSQSSETYSHTVEQVLVHH